MVSATQLCICPCLSQFIEGSGKWIRERRKREVEETGKEQSLRPEPVSKCVSMCVRVAMATICPVRRTFSVKIKTVPGKQGHLVNLNVHKCLRVNQVLLD